MGAGKSPRQEAGSADDEWQTATAKRGRRTVKADWGLAELRQITQEVSVYREEQRAAAVLCLQAGARGMLARLKLRAAKNVTTRAASLPPPPEEERAAKHNASRSHSKPPQSWAHISEDDNTLLDAAIAEVQLDRAKHRIDCNQAEARRRRGRRAPATKACPGASNRCGRRGE
ncbi:MAG: hypothetical protein ACKPKO_23785, partial [Candidatus Fonsibacter sp.]